MVQGNGQAVAIGGFLRSLRAIGIPGGLNGRFQRGLAYACRLQRGLGIEYTPLVIGNHYPAHASGALPQFCKHFFHASKRGQGFAKAHAPFDIAAKAFCTAAIARKHHVCCQRIQCGNREQHVESKGDQQNPQPKKQGIDAQFARGADEHGRSLRRAGVRLADGFVQFVCRYQNVKGKIKADGLGGGKVEGDGRL